MTNKAFAMAAAPRKLVCLVTGANQGIGFETARSLALHTRPNDPTTTTYHVLLGSRVLAKGQAAADSILSSSGGGTSDISVSAIQLDVSSPSSVAAAARVVRERHGRLDVLVNNAGQLCKIGEEGLVGALRGNLETNVLGAAAVTEAFLPLLLLAEEEDDHEDARLVFVTSSMGSLAGAADPGGRYYRSVVGSSPLEYRVSKAALNMMMLEYWKRYGAEERCPAPPAAAEGLGGNGQRERVARRARRVRVWGADPGPNATNFMGPGMADIARGRGIQGPEVGARVLVGCVTGERDGEEGKVVGVYGVGPW